GGVGLPGRDLALAGLPGGCGGVKGLADGLEDRLDVEAEHGADSRGGRWAEVRDVVDLVLVQADRLDEVDLDLVAGRDATDEVTAGAPGVLGDGDDRGDVVAGVRVIRGEERVVVVELTNGNTVRPRCPLRADATAGIR